MTDRRILTWAKAVATGALLGSAAVALRWQLDNALGKSVPFITFYPAVLIAAFFLGPLAGAVSTAICLAGAAYLFMEPRYTLALSAPDILLLVYFAIFSGVLIALSSALRRNLALARRESEARDALAQERRLAVQEMQHRISNNLALLAALIGFHRTRIKNDPSLAPAALDDMQARLGAFARIHRRLTSERPSGDLLEPLVQELCADLAEATGGALDCRTRIAPVSLSVARTTQLVLLVLEAASNAIKHAKGQDGGVRLDIQLDVADGYAQLVVSDDGPGYPADWETRSQASLGTRIMRGLAAQLNGEISFETRGGAAVVARFPVAPA